MRGYVRRRGPTARLFPAMKCVLLPFAFPPGEQPGRGLVVPEPPQIVPDLVRAAEHEPLMRLGDVEIGPERFLLESILAAVRASAALGQFFLMGLRVRHNPRGIQTADESALVVGLDGIDRFGPELLQLGGSVAPKLRLRILTQATGQLRRVSQAAITH